MLIIPENCNKITLQSDKMKNSVDAMELIHMDIDTLYRAVQDETEQLLSEWTGGSKEAFAINAQNVSENMEKLFGKLNILSESATSLELSMRVIDKEAKEAATERTWGRNE